MPPVHNEPAAAASPITDAQASENPAVESSPSRAPSPLRAALHSIDRSLAAIQIVPLLMVIAALWLGQTVIIPIVLAILISYALEPAIHRLQTWHIPRGIAVPVVLLLVAASLGGSAYQLRGQAVAFADRLPVAAHKVAQAIRRNAIDGGGTVQKIQRAASEIETAAAAPAGDSPRPAVASVRVEEPAFRWRDWVWQGSSGAVFLAGQIAAVAFLVYYLLVAGDTYKRKLVRLAGPSMSARKTTVQILDEIDRQIARFLWARLGISAAVGAMIWIAFRWIGLQDPEVWAVLAAVLFTIPYVGPLILIASAGIAGFLQFGTMGTAWAAGGAAAGVAAIEGNVLTPVLMGRVGEMNALAVFVSLMFWGWIWGVWGLLLAVPITAALKAVCERVDDLNGVAEILRA